MQSSPRLQVLLFNSTDTDGKFGGTSYSQRETGQECMHSAPAKAQGVTFPLIERPGDFVINQSTANCIRGAEKKFPHMSVS